MNTADPRSRDGCLVAGAIVRHESATPAGATLEQIETAYAADARRLRRVALGIVGDASTAEDVVQDAFARAVQRRSSFTGRGELRGWVWRVCVNSALNRVRRDRLERRLFAQEQPLEESAASPDSPTEERLRRAVARLPARQRAALFLCYFADLDYASIGEVLGVETGTVGKMLHEARKTVRREIEEDDNGG